MSTRHLLLAKLVAVAERHGWLRPENFRQPPPGSDPNGIAPFLGHDADPGAVVEPWVPKLWTRQEIGLQDPQRPPGRMVEAPEGCIIHCTAGRYPKDEADALAAWRATQNYHRNSRGWNDIGYSFGVNNLGMVLEGRGWGVYGAHTGGTDPGDDIAWNADRHGIAFQGDGEDLSPDGERALFWILGQHVARYGSAHCLGHRDVSRKRCPGDAVYAAMERWNRQQEGAR